MKWRKLRGIKCIGGYRHSKYIENNIENYQYSKLKEVKKINMKVT